MKLHLLRHAKTDQSSITGKDFDRCLLPRGKRQCATLFKYLDQKSWGLVQVYCSTAKRTLQTWEGVERTFSTSDFITNDELYLCSKEKILNTIYDTVHRDDVLVVGHNFGISDLATYLLGQPIELATSEYICIEFPFDQWKEISAETGTLIDRFRPDDR